MGGQQHRVRGGDPEGAPRAASVSGAPRRGLAAAAPRAPPPQSGERERGARGPTGSRRVAGAGRGTAGALPRDPPPALPRGVPPGPAAAARARRWTGERPPAPLLSPLTSSSRSFRWKVAVFLFVLLGEGAQKAAILTPCGDRKLENESAVIQCLPRPARLRRFLRTLIFAALGHRAASSPEARYSSGVKFHFFSCSPAKLLVDFLLHVPLGRELLHS